MTTSTVAARRNGDPQHYVEGKTTSKPRGHYSRSTNTALHRAYFLRRKVTFLERPGEATIHVRNYFCDSFVVILRYYIFPPSCPNPFPAAPIGFIRNISDSSYGPPN